MTPKRKAALQWFHDRGEVEWFRYDENPPSYAMQRKMIDDCQLEKISQGNMKPIIHRLTDKGRQDLHQGDTQ